MATHCYTLLWWTDAFTKWKSSPAAAFSSCSPMPLPYWIEPGGQLPIEHSRKADVERKSHGFLWSSVANSWCLLTQGWLSSLQGRADSYRWQGLASSKERSQHVRLAVSIRNSLLKRILRKYFEKYNRLRKTFFSSFRLLTCLWKVHLKTRQKNFKKTSQCWICPGSSIT